VEKWQKELRFSPLPSLLSLGNEAIVYFARHDILEEEVCPIETLWQLPRVQKMVGKQQTNGSWKYSGGKEHVRSKQNYDQLETYKVLRQLVEKYGFNRKHSAMRKAADFLFSCQSDEGDFRGIYQNQYTPNYTAAIMELLIKAGYEDDSQMERGFRWLLSIRQNDEGWTIPFRTIDPKDSGTLLNAMNEPEPVQPDRSKPFSHCITGVVLRAFAAHPKYRNTNEAKIAGELLKSRFFQPDKYVDRRAANFWAKITYPFWFTDILSALDSLSLFGVSKNGSQIEKALAWLVANQRKDGLWKSSYEKAKDKEIDLWVSLAVCRVFRRFYE
jgi:hypothetical protein